MSRKSSQKVVSETEDEASSKWPEDITLDYFYKPHTISILVLAIGGLILTAFLR